MSVALSFGTGKGSGTDTGKSIVVVVPDLLGMLKLGPHGLGIAAGVSTNAEAVLEATAGFNVFFLDRYCLKRANRSGNILFGIVTVFLAALSCTIHSAQSDSEKQQTRRQFADVPQRHCHWGAV